MVGSGALQHAFPSKGSRAFVEGRGSESFPMTHLLLNDEEADMSWQKGLNDMSKRHHVRI